MCKQVFRNLYFDHNIGYDNMQRMTSQSATVASTLYFLNNYAYNADSQVTQITQQGQTGGNSVSAKLVNFTFDHDGRVTGDSSVDGTDSFFYDTNITFTTSSIAGSNARSIPPAAARTRPRRHSFMMRPAMSRSSTTPAAR